MTRSQIVRAWVIAAAVAAAVPAARLVAAPIGGEGAGPIKDVACRVVGCSTGEAKCAEAHGEISDPLIGKISVTWFCYEPKAEL